MRAQQALSTPCWAACQFRSTSVSASPDLALRPARAFARSVQRAHTRMVATCKTACRALFLSHRGLALAASTSAARWCTHAPLASGLHWGRCHLQSAAATTALAAASARQTPARCAHQAATPQMVNAFHAASCTQARPVLVVLMSATQWISALLALSLPAKCWSLEGHTQPWNAPARLGTAA